ncbi:hypothetical protein H2203_005050 [Taxawa tesnikishii (nom. ined.)]|nr:hypothetical protein H2203_005050 [Dothideales sp. JES 119]
MPLDSVDLLFTGSELVGEGEEVKQPFRRKMQWSVVARAAEEVKKQKKLWKASDAFPSSIRKQLLRL